MSLPMFSTLRNLLGTILTFYPFNAKDIIQHYLKLLQTYPSVLYLMQHVRTSLNSFSNSSSNIHFFRSYQKQTILFNQLPTQKFYLKHTFLSSRGVTIFTFTLTLHLIFDKESYYEIIMYNWNCLKLLM